MCIRDSPSTPPPILPRSPSAFIHSARSSSGSAASTASDTGSASSTTRSEPVQPAVPSGLYQAVQLRVGDSKTGHGGTCMAGRMSQEVRVGANIADSGPMAVAVRVGPSIGE
eukprot:3260550-Rhodomonas_salina.1